MAGRLSASMTLREFENGYWYLVELKDFASQLGMPGATRLRKDELERAIVGLLRSGTLAVPTRRALRPSGEKDLERGLSLTLRIRHYTSNRETKDFILREALRMAPGLRAKSGVWYRLNRWREEQITDGHRPTYGDLVRRFVELNRIERFEKIPHGRYINFMSAFLAAKEGTRADAMAAWAELKMLDAPKDYASWRRRRRP